MEFGERLKELRKQKKLTQQQLGDIVHVSKVSISGYERGERSPDRETLTSIADYFEVSTDYLLGRSSEKEYYSLNNNAEKDIASDLEQMINVLSGNGLLFSNDTSKVDTETRELLIASLEQSLRIAKMEAKKKFTQRNIDNGIE